MMQAIQEDTPVGIVEVSPVGLVPHRRTHLWIWASVAL